ncbi:MAG: LysM peptidoglycan-binding domain-containing protein [Thermodesulfobacteriota bacterium]
MPDYKVKQGDCLSSIATQYGISWDKIWNHPKNISLKNKRQDPNVLYPGDVVFIPDKEDKEESGRTEQKHRFKKKGTPSKMRIRMLKNDKPRSDEPYRLNIDGIWREGTTDGDGYIEASIPSNAKKGILYLGEPGKEDIYHFNFGHLDPIDTEDGVRERLKSLGFRIDQNLSQAICSFQKKEGLQVTGQMDETTKARLKEQFGQ